MDRLGCDEYSHNFFAPCAGSIAAALPPAGGYVHRLPVMTHADNYLRRTASEMGSVLRLLSDNWHFSSVVGVPPHLPAAAWSRLRSELPLSSQVWTLDGSGFRHVAHHSLHMTPATAVDCRLVADPDSATRPVNTPTVNVWPLSRIEWPRLPRGVRGPWDSLLIGIEGREDVDALERLAGESPGAYVWQLPPAIAAALTCIRDSCRWGSADCPAALGRRWLAGESGNLRPCFAAPAGTEQSIEAVQRRFAALADEVADRRGCAECPVSQFCSRCLYPAPLTVSEYCALRRRNPGISALADGLTLTKELMQGQRLGMPAPRCTIHSFRHLRGGTLEWSGRQFPIASCLLVTGDRQDQAFLCSRAADLLVELDVERSRDLQALVRE